MKFIWKDKGKFCQRKVGGINLLNLKTYETVTAISMRGRHRIKKSEIDPHHKRRRLVLSVTPTGTTG